VSLLSTNEDAMTTSVQDSQSPDQATAGGSLEDGDTLVGRAGPWEFPVGGPDGRGAMSPGASPYDLLSAALAACTALTVRLHARHKNYPLSHLDVAVTYHQGDGGDRGRFERVITLEGSLDEDQRAQLLRGAEGCPVSRSLGVSVEIRSSSAMASRSVSPVTDYARDLEEFSIVNIDPD
jgi:putative redox protein